MPMKATIARRPRGRNAAGKPCTEPGANSESMTREAVYKAHTPSQQKHAEGSRAQSPHAYP
eukprot:12935642-Prorocentrum_lima.AAC.1